MEPNEKKMIIIIIVIGLIIIGGIVLLRNIKSKENEQYNLQTEKNSIQENKSEENNQINNNSSIIDELTQISSDGTRVNISNKIKETKMLDGLEINITQLIEKNNVTSLLGTITNKTNKVKGEYSIKIIAKDQKGNKIAEAGGYIGETKPGETTELNCSATSDYVNAYDLEISKK